jgi:hypothetical protein
MIYFTLSRRFRKKLSFSNEDKNERIEDSNSRNKPSDINPISIGKRLPILVAGV